MSLFDSALRSAQAAIDGGMRTTSTMQRPSDDAANARARARRGKKKNRGNNGQLSAQDMIALFQSMPTPNRGFRRPGGDQPHFLGGGLDQFYAKNPSIAQGPARAEQIAAERQQQTSRGFEAGRAAVDFAKQTKGYTDAQGNFVPPTMPTTPSSNYGTGGVEFLPPGQKARGTMTDPLTGKPVFMDEYLRQQAEVQATKFGPAADQVGQDYFNPSKITVPPPTTPSTILATRMPQQNRAGQGNPADIFPGPADQIPVTSPDVSKNPQYDWMTSLFSGSQPPQQTPNLPGPNVPYVPGQYLDLAEMLRKALTPPKRPVTPSHERNKEPFMFPPLT